MEQLTIIQNSVTIGSLQHIIPIVVAIIITIWSINYSRNKFNKAQQQKFIHFFACFISLCVICFHLYRICFDGYNFNTDLPLYLCSLMALLIPVLTYYRKYWMFEVLVFLVIGGTLQAVITPDITTGFPSFDYFRYWIAHLGLLIIIFYFIFVFKMRPKLKSVFKSFFALQVYVLFVIVINYLLNANYSYLNGKPKSVSLLDYFGEWPYYIVVCQLIVIPLFLVIYLPFYISKRRVLLCK
ncbi:TIGR02206 family membrane protein [Winogradskyella sp.]|nr:TIGR02206 family membrane protein [Winogradskyella sp.]